MDDARMENPGYAEDPTAGMLEVAFISLGSYRSIFVSYFLGLSLQCLD